MSMEKAREAVSKGAKFLDNSNKVPNNWRERINLDTLDLNIASSCVIGQIFGSGPVGTYYKALESLGVTRMGMEYTLGFNASRSVDFSYGELTAAWKEYLTTPKTETVEPTFWVLSVEGGGMVITKDDKSINIPNGMTLESVTLLAYVN